MTEIVFKNVTKKYGDKVIFKNLTLAFPASGFVSITGPSGTGKTTLINLLLGLTKADSGSVSLHGKHSVVFQEDRLLPWDNVLNNVLLPYSGNVTSEIREKAIRILTELGLSKEIYSLPSELSGGMARRVAIARSLLVDADIYIMDEATRGLDDETRQSVLNVIHRYTDQAVDTAGLSHKKLLIMITHNPDETAGSLQFVI